MKYKPFEIEVTRPLQIGFLERSDSKAVLKFKEFYIANRSQVSWHSTDMKKLQFDDGTIVKVIVLPNRENDMVSRNRFLQNNKFDQLIIPLHGEEFDLFMYKEQSMINDIYSYVLSESCIPSDFLILHYEY